LDPNEVAGTDQAARDRIDAPYELVPEPQHSVVTVLAMFEHFGPAQVGKSEVEVESGVGQECRDGLFRSTEAVLRVKAHRQILSRSGGSSRSRSLGARRATAYQPTK
jgi:hypothetical protein